MTKSKNLLKSTVVALLLLFSAMVLFACGKSEVKREYIANGNGSVIQETVDGKKVYRAVPDKWHTFVGWYDGKRKYSEDEILKIKNSTPSKMEARFKTSGKSTIDRHLESFYNSYVDGERKEGEYLNYSLSSQFEYTKDGTLIQKVATINGYIDFNQTSQFAFEIKGQASTDFALYYDNTAENAMIYVQIENKKYAYTDIGLLTNVFSALQNPSQLPWNLDNIITDEDAQYLINQYFGVKNTMGFVDKTENSENYSSVTFSYDKILNFLKYAADSSGNATVLENLLYILTSEYKNTSLPKMSLAFKTNYSKEEGCEFIDGIEVVFDLNKDYVLNVDGSKYTIPKMTAKFKMTDFEFGFANEANSISSEVISSFPEATVNMINVHADGELDFVSTTTAGVVETSTVIDKYKIEFDADLNPLALLAFKKDRENSYYDIEWEKLGFLSFKVSLVPETDATALKAQQKRHNYTNDYINIMIDTKNNGANAYVFVGLYTPETLFSSSYIFNHSFNIPSLLEILKKEDDNTSKSLMTLFAGLVAGGVSLEKNTDANKFMQDTLNKLLSLVNVDSQLIENNLTMTDDGFKLALGQIRTEIRNYEKDFLKEAINLPLDFNIKLDKKLFGDDEENNITHLEINMNSSTIDTVIKNAENEYLNEEGEVIIDNFNAEHSLIVGVDEETGISQLNSPITIEDALALKGTKITLEKAILSDGNVTTTHTNNKGKSKALNMIVEDVQIISSTENSAKVRVLLQFQDYANSLSSIPLIGEQIYELTGVPYGLICYETTVQIKVA